MSALAITPANVKPVVGQTQIISSPIDLCTATYSAGMFVYKDASGGWQPAVANGTALQATVKGMALNDALVVGGSAGNIGVGQITIGTHGVTVGTFYFLDVTAGESGPFTDLSSTNFVTQVCQFDTTTTCIVKPNVTGITHG